MFYLWLSRFDLRPLLQHGSTPTNSWSSILHTHSVLSKRGPRPGHCHNRKCLWVWHWDRQGCYGTCFCPEEPEDRPKGAWARCKQGTGLHHSNSMQQTAVDSKLWPLQVHRSTYSTGEVISRWLLVAELAYSNSFTERWNMADPCSFQ